MNFLKFGRSSVVRLFFLTLIIPALFAACTRSESKTRGGGANTNANTTQEEVIQVTQTKAEARQVPSVIQATGSLVAEETSDVAPKVAGKVVNVSANVGQFVSQGAVIAKIDDKDALLRLAEAKAGVTQAIAGVRQAEARLGLSPNGTFTASTIPEVRAASSNVEQAQAELRQAEVNLRQAEVNEKRFRELVETGDRSVMEYETYRTARDAARTARDTALARVNTAKQNLETAINTAKQNNQAIKSAQANVEAARTQVGTAEQAVADTVVRAPFPGYVSARPVAVGEYVSSASIIATILRTNPIKVQIQVAEADVPYVGIGRGVSIQVDAYKDRNFGGTVTAVNPSIDPNSRSAIVEAQIENGDNALRSGMFATVKITREGGSLGVFVPKEAVLNDQSTQSQRIFVIVEGIAKLRTVQVGTEENGTIQILNGVAADEMVATSNLPQLYEGAKVQVQ
ncbi:MAG TPA: efflux RND transporter periplasmic adaptor subunit [Pyrinomonadaceae bacterium]|jgi:multidrug efflux pump subunit AcrA (membrane-fusion protein)|nr:efflux RND transporter periplasmic adaptor subunit [Pyrinomonadaceae bacterium]